jgi:hypothetical protein
LPRKKKNNSELSTGVKGEIGLLVANLIFTKFGWLTRDQPKHDHGIDSMVEIYENKKATARLFALQVKTGKSYLKPKGENFLFYGEKRHYEYYERYPVPVFIIFHDEVESKTRWVQFDVDKIQLTKSGWVIEVAGHNYLNEASKDTFEKLIPSNSKIEKRVQVSFSTDATELNAELDGLSAEEKEIRIRILGYCNWFAPLSKKELSEYLNGEHSSEDINWHTTALVKKKLLIETPSHIYPNKKDPKAFRIIEQAMQHSEAEIIRRVIND